MGLFNLFRREGRHADVLPASASEGWVKVVGVFGDHREGQEEVKRLALVNDAERVSRLPAKAADIIPEKHVVYDCVASCLLLFTLSITRIDSEDV